MKTEKEIKEILPRNLSWLLLNYTANLMAEFYEMQSTFLSGIYKRYKSIETANIILCLAKEVHLQIIRQRERNMNHDISLDNFWNNFNNISRPTQKIVYISNMTGIPKETTRRKIKKLINQNFVLLNKKNKEYYWTLLPNKKEEYFKVVDYETKNLAIFISKISKCLNINFDTKIIENEIKSQFSFYWYHYLSCQIDWLKMWQLKLKDNELLLISLQTTIPTLQYIDKNMGKINLEDVHKIIGHVNRKDEAKNCSVGATSVSDVTGIPRATCIRKLEKLVNLGFLIRRDRNKRYVVNQISDARTKNIMKKENITNTIKTFSECISIILNSLIHNRTSNL